MRNRGSSCNVLALGVLTLLLVGCWTWAKDVLGTYLNSEVTSKRKNETIAESLVVIRYFKAKENHCANAINPLWWEGLPVGARLTYGHLIIESGPHDFQAPHKFGVQGVNIGAQSFLSFDLISNFKDGRAYSRIFGSLETTGQAKIMPCYIAKLDPENIAVLTANRLASVKRQQDSRYDDISAIVK